MLDQSQGKDLRFFFFFCDLQAPSLLNFFLGSYKNACTKPSCLSICWLGMRKAILKMIVETVELLNISGQSYICFIQRRRFEERSALQNGIHCIAFLSSQVFSSIGWLYKTDKKKPQDLKVQLAKSSLVISCSGSLILNLKFFLLYIYISGF